MKSISFFYFLFITCAIATDPRIQIVSTKDPCGCSNGQINFIKASVSEAEEQLLALMEHPITPEETVLAGHTSEARRTGNMKMLKTVATHLEHAQSLKIIDKIADPGLDILNVICNDPNHSQPPLQGQGTLYQHVLHLGPSFFTLLGAPPSPAELVEIRVKADIRNYAKAMKTHQGSVTPFQNDQYPIPRNPGSAILRFVLASRLLTGLVLVVPQLQHYKGDTNVLMWMALAFTTKYKEAKAKPPKLHISVPKVFPVLSLLGKPTQLQWKSTSNVGHARRGMTRRTQVMKISI